MYQKIARADMRRCRKEALGAPFCTEKQFAGPVELVDERIVRFTISTASVDRQNDVIKQEGWDFTHYRRNPVVLWGHDSRRMESLIGRAVELGVVEGKLKAAVEFVPKDVGNGVGEAAEACLWLCRNQFLNATSVGFRPIEWDFTEDEARGADDWFPGIDFIRQELLEFSIVSIPANPEALIEPPPAASAPPNGTAAAAAAEIVSRARSERDRQRQRARLLALT